MLTWESFPKRMRECFGVDSSMPVYVEDLIIPMLDQEHRLNWTKLFSEIIPRSDNLNDYCVQSEVVIRSFDCPLDEYLLGPRVRRVATCLAPQVVQDTENLEQYLALAALAMPSVHNRFESNPLHPRFQLNNAAVIQDARELSLPKFMLLSGSIWMATRSRCCGL
jgi:hypothetical protein